MPSLSLPEVLDRTTVSDFAATIRALRGDALSLDAGPLRRLSGVALEMLLSVRRQWSEDGQAFAIGNWSGDMAAVLTQLGADADMFLVEKAT